MDKATLPLHFKPEITPIRLESLLCLGNKTPSCRSFLIEALRWLDDPSKYGTFQPAPKRPRFSKVHFDAMKGYKYAPMYGLPKGFVDAFLHVEASKEESKPYRLRPIFAPDANSGIAREDLQRLHMALRPTIRERSVGNPELVVQFDMKSCYDQFPLGENVRPFMCLLGPDGAVYALSRLAMGLRPACEVAQAALWFLLDFDRDERVTVDSYIDNIRFVGPREPTTVAIRTFLERCEKAGVQLDRYPASRNDEHICALDERQGDFLGEHYDYAKGTRCLTQKTIAKLEIVRDAVDFTKEVTLSARQFSALMGLFFWTASVLSIKLAPFFHLLRAYRNSGADASNTSFDSVETTLNSTAKRELKEWLDIALANTPVPMVPPQGDPSLVLVADASAAGYGAFAQVRGSNEWKVMSGAWPDHLKEKAQSSVFAEPECVYLACLRFVRPDDKFVRVYTDHSPLVYASAAGYAKGFHPNELLLRLQKKFPGVVFEIIHIKGEHNPSDYVSRLGGEVGENYKLGEDEKKKLTMLEAVMWEGSVKDNVLRPSADNKPSFMN